MSVNMFKWEGIKKKFLEERTVRILFFIMMAALPFVNKFSKLTAVLFLIAFFTFVRTYRNFKLPRGHKFFLMALVFVVTIGNLLEGSFLCLKHDMYLSVFILIFYAVVYFLQQDILKLKHIAYAVMIPMGIYLFDGLFQYIEGYDIFFHNPLTS